MTARPVDQTGSGGGLTPPGVSARRALAACGVGLALLLVGLGGADRARAEDPFKALDLIRPNRRTAAPDFTAPGLSTPSVRLTDFRGHVVLLNFWATWCPPCKEEMPSMERLYGRHKGRGFTIIAVSIDTGEPRSIAAFAKSLGLTFPIALDPRMEVADRYKVRSLPSSVLIDRKGDMVAIALGPRDWDSPAAHAVIASLLAGGPPRASRPESRAGRDGPEDIVLGPALGPGGR